MQIPEIEYELFDIDTRRALLGSDHIFTPSVVQLFVPLMEVCVGVDLLKGRGDDAFGVLQRDSTSQVD
jgi:hypothetical protein